MEQQTSTSAMQAVLEKQQSSFLHEGFVSAATRIDRLRRVQTMIGNNKKAIVDACQADFGHHSRHQAEMSEVGAVMTGALDNAKRIKKWMRPEKRSPMFPLGFMGASARVEHVPKGVVGNLSTWNFPVYTALMPLIGIFAAGNRGMLKMSELTSKTAALIQALAAEYFDEIEFAVITGGPEVGAEFAALPLDHLIFTGGTHIGKHILQAAANNLTPCTLELGGKSPVIVGRSYDIEKAAQRIFSGKALNTGQACLAPDYAFVHEDDKETFIQAITDHVTELFPSVLKNDDYTAVINERHYQRIMSYINDARDKGGDVRQINPKNEDFNRQPEGIRKLPMTLIVDPSDDMLAMQEEIFGPVLSIKTYKNISECIQYINNRPRPLGLYYFGKDAAEERMVLDKTISGGVTINDVMNHSSNDDLPFGGIGQSGMGNYHGYDGFRTFSHPRAIFKQTNLDLMKLAGMLPPYGDKSQRQLDKMTQVKWPRKI